MTPNINKILATTAFNACNSRGSNMGRRNYVGKAAKLYVQRVRFCDGCYDVGGAYWGLPADLWCAFTEDLETMVFVRADSRKDAKTKALGYIADKCRE